MYLHIYLKILKIQKNYFNMSYTEIHIGTLKEVDLGGKTLEDWCKIECERLKINKSMEYDSYLEIFLETYSNYKLLNDKLYLCKDKELDEGEINYMFKNPDGTYSYVMQFYNGGTYLDEVLEWALKYSSEYEQFF